MISSRRTFLRNAAATASVLASGAVLGCYTTRSSDKERRTAGPANKILPLNPDWLFGGKFTEAATRAEFNDASFSPVILPHCVTKLSWQKWNPATWEDTWIYRRHLGIPKDLENLRLFLDFDGVTVGATPFVNGHELPRHLGGYLPFHYELTGLLDGQENVIALKVDSRWSQAPPQGSPKGAAAVDYYIPGGITRGVRLRAVPKIFISDVFARPVAVLDPQRRVEVGCSLDAAMVPAKRIRIKVELFDGSRQIATVSQTVRLEQTGETAVKLELTKLGNISLWDIQNPKLYEVLVTLLVDDSPVHDYRVRMGFREARFEIEGFFLNGKRLQIFGLDRHELFPYVGSAMPGRVMRRDAEILKHEFNCNMVRCSHYPQSTAFLEACNELGIMVWEELPGWQFVGDQAWQDLAVRDVEDMVRRDRNHPAVVIWGVRVNESANNPAFYTRTKQAAKALDDSRPTSGAMNSYSTKNWGEDVYAYDDYHSAPDGTPGVRDPLPGVPYFLSEAVGGFSYGTGKGDFSHKYRRAGDREIQEQQAIFHATVHNKAGANSRIGGVIAWCAFDYASPINSYNGVKCPGIADVFRIPKLGAAFYRTQGDPRQRPVIEPNFYWHFGPQSPSGPGKKAAIFSNCDRLELFLAGKHYASAQPDHANFPHLKHPPFFVDLELDGAAHPELRIEGYLGETKALSRSFSSDPATTQLFFKADDCELISDGADATRLAFQVTDKFGAPFPFLGGEVRLELKGPGILIGDNPFLLDDNGGAGAVWVKTVRGRNGRIQVTATHSSLGKKQVEVLVVSAEP
jgi:beta-galactosidase